MHIVHIKDPYTSLDDIKDMKDGLAVIGVLLEAPDGAADNPAYQNLLETASQCSRNGKILIMPVQFMMFAVNIC